MWYGINNYSIQVPVYIHAVILFCSTSCIRLFSIMVYNYCNYFTILNFAVLQKTPEICWYWWYLWLQILAVILTKSFSRHRRIGAHIWHRYWWNSVHNILWTMTIIIILNVYMLQDLDDNFCAFTFSLCMQCGKTSFQIPSVTHRVPQPIL